jgi:O-methyltransferase
MDGVDAINYILNNNIEGVIIECGVEAGNFEYLWINELMKHNAIRDIYLYDTFGGLVKPTE